MRFGNFQANRGRWKPDKEYKTRNIPPELSAESDQKGMSKFDRCFTVNGSGYPGFSPRMT